MMDKLRTHFSETHRSLVFNSPTPRAWLLGTGPSRALLCQLMFQETSNNYFKRRIVRIKRIDIEKFVLQAKRELNEFLEVAFNSYLFDIKRTRSCHLSLFTGHSQQVISIFNSQFSIFFGFNPRLSAQAIALIFTTCYARCTVYVQYMYSICTLRKRTNTVHILYIYCTTGSTGANNQAVARAFFALFPKKEHKYIAEKK